MKIHWRYIQFIQLQCSNCGNTIPCVWTVAAGSGCGTEAAGFWGDVWLHGILTNISWTRTVVEVLLCMHRLAASTRIWPISLQAWPFVLHCLAWNGLVLFLYICVCSLFSLWGSCVELLISWYVFFSIRQKLLLIDMCMIIFSSLLITTYTVYAPSLLHAVIEAKASRSSFWCLSSPVNNRRTAIIQNTIYKQRMYRDNDKMQLAGKQLNCVLCPNACYCFSCQQINIAQLACLALSLWTTLNIERHIYHVQ
jgi:hypothetical protein